MKDSECGDTQELLVGSETEIFIRFQGFLSWYICTLVLVVMFTLVVYPYNQGCSYRK